MKKFATSHSLCVALFTGVAATAQPSPASPEKIIVPSPVQVMAQPPYLMSSDELREFAGQYALQDGSTLTVFRKSGRLFSVITGQEEVELVATAPDSFVTKTGATEVRFRQAANGNVFGVELRRSGEKLAQR